MIPYQPVCTYRRSRANEERARRAARRQAATARAALAVLAENGVGPNLSSTRVWRRQWIEVLRRRAADDVSTLGGLAASMTPPMTKDAFAGQLRRACRFAADLAAGNDSHRFAAERPFPARFPQHGGASQRASEPDHQAGFGAAGPSALPRIDEDIQVHSEDPGATRDPSLPNENPRKGQSHVGL